MSGDVFGNGMLLSKYIWLIVVFDYCYIFFDFNFDVVVLWVECWWMFELFWFSWGDYDRFLISEGGGVYSCEQKVILFSVQVCVVFGIDGLVDGGVVEMVLFNFIWVILWVLVDLLFNGGIGIYIKVELELDVDVGDCVNDLV